MKVGQSKKKQIIIASSVVLAVAIIASVILLWPPERSATAFCSELDRQNNALVTSGKKYSLGPVYSSTEDMHAFAQAYDKLDRVAPSDIEPQVRTLKMTAEKIYNDPTQSLGAGLSALGASTDVQDWTTAHCTNHKN